MWNWQFLVLKTYNSSYTAQHVKDWNNFFHSNKWKLAYYKCCFYQISKKKQCKENAKQINLRISQKSNDEKNRKEENWEHNTKTDEHDIAADAEMIVNALDKTSTPNSIFMSIRLQSCVDQARSRISNTATVVLHRTSSSTDPIVTPARVMPAARIWSSDHCGSWFASSWQQFTTKTNLWLKWH